MAKYGKTYAVKKPGAPGTKLYAKRYAEAKQLADETRRAADLVPLERKVKVQLLTQPPSLAEDLARYQRGEIEYRKQQARKKRVRRRIPKLPRY
jgi:hypothetical protein